MIQVIQAISGQVPILIFMGLAYIEIIALIFASLRLAFRETVNLLATRGMQIVIVIFGTGILFGAGLYLLATSVNNDDSVFVQRLFCIWGFFVTFLTAVPLILLPYIYNFKNRNSDVVLSYPADQRHAFLVNNPSWALVDLGNYYLMFASILLAFCWSGEVMNKFGHTPSIGHKLLLVVAFIGPVAIWWLSYKLFLKNIRFLSYKWTISTADRITSDSSSKQS